MVFTNVREPAPYRFDGQPGPYSFARDVIRWAVNGDPDAGARVNRALPAVFDVSTSGLPGTTQTRTAPYTPFPDQWISPIWDAIERPVPWGERPGPFIAPTLGSMAGAVGDHIQGTEPTSGTYVSAGPTITPTPISGKLRLDRAAWDIAQNNPLLDQAMLIEMRRAYRVVLEARAATALAAIASPATIALTGTNVNAALTGQLRPAVVTGTLASHRRAFTGSKLHEALSTAVDANGQLLLQPLNDDLGDGVWLANRPWRYSSQLPSGTSWLLDVDAIHGYATAPNEIRLDPGDDGSGRGSVSQVTLGIWGYAAAVVVYPTNVRRITY